jgi:pimeloyl-ACP methyl ester carboxylesterase
MNWKTSAVVFSALSVMTLGVWLEARAQTAKGNPPPSTIPTFSTSNIGRQGHFYVGGKWAGEPGNEVMHGAMYVEVWVPKQITHPYPVVFIVGSVGQGAYELIQTPDGRPGWAYDFVNRGYTVYMMDLPARGRSAYVPGLDGTVNPPRSGPLMEEVWSGGRPPATPQTSWPQYTKQTQWPGNGPNKGKMGDPVFDYYAKTEVQSVAGGAALAKTTIDDIEQLIDMIGQPVILLLHSGLASTGWAVADARSKVIKGIVAAEPVAPPIENAERGGTGRGRLWGLSDYPLRYEPPVTDAAELHPVRQEKADAADLLPCWVQQEPAHKLANLQGIPVLQVSGEASYHRPYSHCVAKWLNQAGVKTEYVRLEDVGQPGNGHQFMSEKNSAGISKFFMDWLDKNVH